GVEPIPVILEDLDASWVGRETEASGYGQTENGSTGTRLFSALPIASFERSQRGEMIVVNGNGRGGVCRGDSGGPIMVRSDSGSVRVVGVVSTGDGSCTVIAKFTRADYVRPWIESTAGPIPPDEDPGCGDVTSEGRCMDGAAVYCGPDAMLRRDECAAGQACGYDAAQGGYRCLQPASDPCQGIDSYGTCDGQVARWCERGQLRSRDCGACGQACGEVSEFGAIYCREDACAGVDYQGRCEGATAYWCDDGMLKSKDCAVEGKTCGWVSEELGNFCQ